MEREEILTKIRKAIRQKDSEAEIILFGSRARGNENDKSDWDILVLLNKPTVDRELEKEYREEIFNVELETNQAISTFVFSKEDWETKHSVTPLYENVKSEGIRL